MTAGNPGRRVPPGDTVSFGGRRPRMHVLGWLALGVAGLVVTSGCTNQGEPVGRTDPDADALGHVHGLGVDPGDGTLYAATHFGVFRVAEDGSLSRVADRWQDTMAFTVVGPGHFLGSGHPDRREDLPAHLGLIESVDAARSWSVVSLGGEADFHALDVSGDRIYGYDATSGRILTTTDRQNWRRVAREPVVDLAADPTDADHVLASAPDGGLRLHDRGARDPTDVATAPGLVLLEWPTADFLVGVSADGYLHQSAEAGKTWARAGTVPGEPQAFDATEEAWHVATDQGIYRSVDGGSTWTLVVDAVG
jgi:hypothetical protein